jgi:hypothetical protein
LENVLAIEPFLSHPGFRIGVKKKAASLAMSFDSATPIISESSIIISEDLSMLSLRGKIVDEIVSHSLTILPFLDSIQNEIDNWILRNGPDATIILEPGSEHVRVLDVFRGSVDSEESAISKFPASSFVKRGLLSSRNGAVRILYGRRAFRSGRGKFGLASSYANVGDVIVLFDGGSVPYIVRPQGNVFKLIGEALVADYIEGYQIFNHSDVRTITLI